MMKATITSHSDHMKWLWWLRSWGDACFFFRDPRGIQHGGIWSTWMDSWKYRKKYTRETKMDRLPFMNIWMRSEGCGACELPTIANTQSSWGSHIMGLQWRNQVHTQQITPVFAICWSAWNHILWSALSGCPEGNEVLPAKISGV